MMRPTLNLRLKFEPNPIDGTPYLCAQQNREVGFDAYRIEQQWVDEAGKDEWRPLQMEGAPHA